jgi:Glu-tRNA(Gln) amidotransferase subunit E-like FAD-binding protein
MENLVLRLPEYEVLIHIKVNEFSKILFHCPAVIPEEVVQKEIMRCLDTALNNYESGTFNPIAVLQAKAKNSYILKRAFVRRSRETYETKR